MLLTVSCYEVLVGVRACFVACRCWQRVLHVFEARAERVLLDSGFVQGADATTHVSDLLPDHAGWVRRQGA